MIIDILPPNAAHKPRRFLASASWAWCDPFVRNRPFETGGWAAKNGSPFFDNFRLMLVR
jgi:hypothetical protein